MAETSLLTFFYLSLNINLFTPLNIMKYLTGTFCSIHVTYKKQQQEK